MARLTPKAKQIIDEEVAKRNAEIAKDNEKTAAENAWKNFYNGEIFKACLTAVKDFIKILTTESDLENFVSDFSKINHANSKFSSDKAADFFNYVEVVSGDDAKYFKPIIDRSKIDEGILAETFSKALASMDSIDRSSFNDAVLNLRTDYQDSCEVNSGDLVWGDCSGKSHPLDAFAGVNDGYNCCILD